MTQPFRSLLWDSKLDSEMNVRYWGFLGRYYANWEKFWKIFLALFSATSALGSWVFFSSYPLAWRTLLGISAVVAIALPFLDYSGIALKASDQRGKWSRLQSEYDILWARSEADPTLPIDNEFKQIQEAVAQTGRDEALLPLNERLRQKAYKEVYDLHKPNPSSQ